MKLYIKSSSGNSEKKFNLLEKRIKEAVDIINNWMKTESTSLLEVLDDGTNTYKFAYDYLINDHTLDVESIINDYRDEIQVGGYWDPRDFLFNILHQCIGMSYDKARAFLCY